MSQMIFRVHANCEADVDELNILLSQGYAVERTVQWPSFEWTDKVFEKHVCEPCVDYILTEPTPSIKSETKPWPVAWQLFEEFDAATKLAYYEVRVAYSDNSCKCEKFKTHDDALTWVNQHGLTPKMQIL